MSKKTFFIIGGVLGLLSLTYVVVSFFLHPVIKIGYLENEIGNKMQASFYYFDGVDKKNVTFNKGDKVTIKHFIGLENGNMNISIKDEKGNEVINKLEGSGENTFIASETQNYTIEITALKAKGMYDLIWVQ